MQRLPSAEEQDWLIESLAQLIASTGPSQFVSMRIVLPTREYFPDPWEPGLQGLDRVTRRLMQYASLGELEPEITLFSVDDPPQLSDRRACRSIAGVFLGIEHGKCRFAFNVENLADGEHAAGVMAHEVAHAFRALHNINNGGEEEEILTDVTMTYLGFGILGANNSYRYRTSGDILGAWVSHVWSSRSSGYIPPQAFGFLLALQLAARATGPSQVKRLLAHLELNQRDFTQAAIESCGNRGPTIADRLGLPPRQQFPAQSALETIQRALPEFVAPPDSEPRREPTILVNAGRPVFRIHQTNAMFYAAWLGFVAGLGGALVGVIAWDSKGGVFAGVAGAVAGLLWGHRTRWDVCSDRGCGAVLQPALKACPGCGGLIAGSIRSASHRLAAEEAWEDARRAD